MKRVLTTLLAIGLAVGACGSGIASDDGLRDIPAADQVELGIGDNNAGAAIGTARVYFLSPEVVGQAALLESVARDVAETPIGLLQELLAGPHETAQSNQFRTALPAGPEFLDARRQG